MHEITPLFTNYQKLIPSWNCRYEAILLCFGSVLTIISLNKFVEINIKVKVITNLISCVLLLEKWVDSKVGDIKKTIFLAEIVIKKKKIKSNQNE